MTRQIKAAFQVLCIFGLLLLTVVPALAQSAEPRLTVERANPPLEATVSAAPTAIAIWFEQAIDAGPDSAAIEVFSQAGERQPIGRATVYHADPRHISAPVLGAVGPGTYSVVWTVRLAGDASERSGAYGFRVGPAAIPGAATTSDAWPALWAVITRFLTLFGLALVLGGFAVTGHAMWRGLDASNDHRRRVLALGGAVIALIGTVIEPAIDALLTVPSPAIPSLLSGYPSIWWLRVGAIAGLVTIAVAAVSVPARSSAMRRSLWLGGVVLAAVALTSLSAANVASRLGPSTPAANLLVIVVQVVLVILAGVYLHTAIGPSSESTGTSPFRLTQWLVPALGVTSLILLAVLSGLLLTGPGDLVHRPFGWLLVALAGLLLIALALALAFRRSERGGAGWGIVGPLTLTLVGVATLALTVPPGKAAEGASLAVVDLVAPVAVKVNGEPGLVHLLYQPAATGQNALAVWLANAEGEIPDPAKRPTYAIELTSLHDLTPPIRLVPEIDQASNLATTTGELPGQGWWQADVMVTPPDGEPTTVTFFLLLPDPNVHGYGPQPGSSPAAEAVFERGLATMTGLHQVRFSVGIGGGSGTFARSAIAINDGGDGSVRSYREQSASYETVIIGDRQWLRQGTEEWTERQAGHIFTPAEWGETYEPATGFALGPVVDLAGEPTQVVTFWLPRQENPRQEPAWYAWWVGTETGQVRRETMISTRHYMVYDFSGFNQPVEITAPAVD